MPGKKLLFIVLSLRRAGAQIQLVDLVNNISDDKFEKHIFTIEPQSDLLDRLDQNNIHLYNKQRKFKYDLLSVAKEIARVVDEQEIDLVHCTLQFSLLLGWVALKIAKRTPCLIAAIHTTQNRSFKEELQDRILYQQLLKLCDRVIFVCHKQRDVWIRKYPHLTQNAVVVHNGIDENFFAVKNTPEKLYTLKQELAIPKEAKVLCCIAGFRPEKAHLNLLEAVSRLYPVPHLLLAGEGKLQEEIQSRADILGIRSRVHFLGSLSDVRGVLIASDISVLASIAVETFSIAMLESMSMGVPVIATNIGGMSEAIFPGETGDLVSLGNSDGLEIALQKLLKDEETSRRMGRQCRNLVLERFTTQKMVAKTEYIIHETLAHYEAHEPI